MKEKETKNCQNCKNDFIIEPEDFNFYKKIKVPPPTFCSECRFIRRLVWRNERTLYRRICNLCKKNIIAMYHESMPFPVYCRECWYGDGWDASVYARDYDFNKTFFEQYREFSNAIPRLALWQRNMINSEYSNMTGESRNVYLSASVVKNSENVFYSKSVDKCKDIIDCLNISNDSSDLYENIEVQNSYNSQYLLLCKTCIDSYYLVDCINCSNCFLSYNLRNKKFCIYNKQYSEEDYFKELEKFDLKSKVSRNLILEKFNEIRKKAIYRFANISKSLNVTGNNISNVKNAQNCFDIYNAENAKYVYRAFDFKDYFDVDFAQKSELLYEYTTGALNDYNVKFSYSAMSSVSNAEYTEFCVNCSDIFGCISLKNKKFAIFNKVYSEEKYQILRTKIIEQMNNMPYVDRGGRTYKYGEFFPIEISPWSYNETLAQEFFPITKKESEKYGYPWHDQNEKIFKITVPASKIEDNIDKVYEKILEDVLGCTHKGECNHQCSTAFRLTNYELSFYKKHDIPPPVLCSNCRYHERLKITPPLKLWHRKCMKENCKNEFETPYAPNRPEMVYCEKCYQQEVY